MYRSWLYAPSVCRTGVVSSLLMGDSMALRRLVSLTNVFWSLFGCHLFDLSGSMVLQKDRREVVLEDLKYNGDRHQRLKGSHLGVNRKTAEPQK